MTWLLVGLGLITALVLVSKWWGASASKRAAAEKNAEIKDRQLEKAINRPSVRDLVERLRRNGF